VSSVGLRHPVGKKLLNLSTEAIRHDSRTMPDDWCYLVADVLYAHYQFKQRV